MDEDTGSVVFGNEEVECNALANNITACKYYLSPTNQRFGLLMDLESWGLVASQASWVIA